MATRPPEPRSPRASIRDVAKLAGVSIATVSRVLNGDPVNTADGLKARVVTAAARLNYKPNQAGRALRTRQTTSVGLVISNIQNSFYAAIASEIEREIVALGRVMLLGATDEDPAIQDQYLREFAAHNVSGVLMLCAVKSEGLARAARTQPVIFINRQVPELGEASFAGIDDYLAARDVARGMRRLSKGPYGVIHGPLYSHTSSERLRGIRDGFAEAGVTAEQLFTSEAKLSMASGYENAARLLAAAPRCRAIFCGSDLIAYGAHRRCRELGLRVPEDVLLFGFDDNPLNDWLAPWLNTVRVPHQALAKAAIELLFELIDGKPHRSILLPYDLVIRNS
jgi:LacI family transcriptional regulator